MKVIAITGTRRAGRNDDVLRYLDAEDPDVVIVGCADGVDDTARVWARPRAILVTVGAPWKKLGKAAGPRRNQHLAYIAAMYRQQGDVWAAAFPDEKSVGTLDAMERFEAAGVDVRKL